MYYLHFEIINYIDSTKIRIQCSEYSIVLFYKNYFIQGNALLI